MDDSLEAISSLLANENIGLGPYGDAIDYTEHQRGAKKNEQVVRTAGGIIFSLSLVNRASSLMPSGCSR